MGCHCWDPWGLAVNCCVAPTFCPLLMSMMVPHGAPDSKILWVPWMANEGHFHGPHMCCQWCGPWGLATSCQTGPRYLPLLKLISPSMGPMYVCNHQANKNPWAPWGAYVCASRNTHITGDRKSHPKRSAVARPGKYDETGSCKVIAFMEHRNHLEQVSCETTICPWKKGYMFVTKLSPHICAYIAICAETGIGITCASQWSTHETAHVKPLS